jgi:DNA-binding transcriptional LysR family regulator
MIDRIAVLRLFVRIVQTGSFSRAAREEKMSQPSASRLIATLEQDLGVSLLARTTRGVRATDAGEVFYERAESILDSLEDAANAVRPDGSLEGRLRVSASSALMARVVMPALPEFMRLHSRVRLDLVVDGGIRDLVSKGVDVSLQVGQLPDSTAVARSLGTLERIIVASPAYLAAHGSPKSPRALRSHVSIDTHGGARASWAFRKDGLLRSVRVPERITVNSDDAATAAARAGLGVLATTRLICAAELAYGQLVELLSDWSLGSDVLHAVHVSGRSATTTARLFTDFLAATLSG